MPLLLEPPPLELPRREAPDVDVVLVEARVVAITRELDLELHLVALDGQFTDGTGRTDPGSAPCAVRLSAWELAIAYNGARFLAQDFLIPHLDDLDAQQVAARARRTAVRSCARPSMSTLLIRGAH